MTKNVEKIARLSGGEKRVESWHVCGYHGCFGPERTKSLCSIFGPYVWGRGETEEQSEETRSEEGFLLNIEGGVIWRGGGGARAGREFERGCGV